MSRKTVSQGTAAAALATLLTLASATPTLAAPRRAGERGQPVQTNVWSFVLELSQRLTGWVFGPGLGIKAGDISGNATTEATYGMDPNGNEAAIDPYSSPTAPSPLVGGGRG
jgi:hypothetical protein